MASVRLKIQIQCNNDYIFVSERLLKRIISRFHKKV